MRACCVICGDAFMPNIEVSATPCGHVFHSLCVAQWFERSKTCPQCRFSCKQKLVRLYFDEGSQETEQDPDTLEFHLNNAKFQIKLKEQEIRNLKEDVEKKKNICEELRLDITSRIDKEKTQASLINSFETQLRFLSSMKDKADKMKAERDAIKAKLTGMQDLEHLVSSTDADVEVLLSDYCLGSSEVARNIATVCVLLKREMKAECDKKKGYRDEVQQLRGELKKKEQQLTALRQAESRLQQQVSHQSSDIHRLEEENLSLSKKLTALQAAIDSPSGDVTNGLVRRLLQENVTPNCLKRNRAQAGEDNICTPEVLRKPCRRQDVTTNVLLDTSRDLFEEDLFESENTPVSCGENTQDRQDTEQLLRQYKMNLTNAESPSISSPYLKVKCTSVQPPVRARQPLLNRPPKHTIFVRKSTSNGHTASTFSSSQPSPAPSSSAGYDGLGGHHRVDEFPRPRPMLVKRKTAPAAKTPTTKIRINCASVPSDVVTIKNFFKNTFDD